ncbi:MAG: hypothetical protein L3J83_00080 [Proteobacteria bacterium]|nr:hypothetical protein [Pseudomonadota bacterium]
MNIKIKKSLKTIALVIILFCLTVVTINTSVFDEELLPEVSAILKEQAFPPVEGNAYFASLGLMEIYGKDITQTGYEITQYHIENHKNNISGSKLTDSQHAEFFGVNSTPDLLWNIPMLTCEMVDEYDCLTKDYDGFYDLGINSKINNQRLQLLLVRFEEIIEMNTYQVYIGNNLSFLDTHFQDIPYSSLRKLSEIQLINTFKNHSTGEFIEQLYKDIKFWKMVLAQGNLLIDKIMALSSIRRDLLHLSEFIRTKNIAPNELITINKILQQLPSEDIDLSDAFEAEAKFMFGTNYYIEKESSIFDNLFFQPNATNNNYYETSIKPQKILSKMPLKQFIEYFIGKRQSETQIQPSADIKFHYLYNPLGKILTEYGKCNCGDYIAIAYDVANMIKLVQTQLKIKLATDNSIINILAKPENLNPYTDKPFAYNEKDNLLEFDCLSVGQECKVRL